MALTVLFQGIAVLCQSKPMKKQPVNGSVISKKNVMGTDFQPRRYKTKWTICNAYKKPAEEKARFKRKK